jgi:hypothetical protein
MKQLLIGLCGRAGCGKDTMASFFTQDSGMQRYALAGPLKAGLTAMLDIPPGMLEDRVYKERRIDWLGKSPREMLQTLGTEWGRQMVHDDIWTNLMAHRWEIVKAMGLPGMVVTDVRFNNEARKIIKSGGYIIRIDRAGIGEVAPHKSEQGIDDEWIDETIHNDEGIQKLRREAARIVRELS